MHTAQPTVRSSNVFDLTPLDLIPPRFYSRFALAFKTSASADRLLPELQAALNKTCQSLPWLGGQVLPNKNEDDEKPGLRVTWDEGACPIIKDLGTLPGSFQQADANGMPVATIQETQWPAPGRITETLERTGAPVMAAGLLSFDASDGVVLCTCTHHSVVDGGGYTEIMKIWSKVLSGLPAPQIARLDRNERLCSVLQPHIGKTLSSSRQELLASNTGYATQPMPFEPDFGHCINTILSVSSSRVEQLKARLSDHTTASPTTNTVICAVLWSALTRARKARRPDVFAQSQESRLGMPSDGRRRVHSDFSPDEDPYFGNFYTYTATALPTDALTSADDTSITRLAEVCDAIASTLSPEKLDSRNIAEVYALATRSETSPALFPAWSITNGKDLGITSWAGFGLYEMTFGSILGRPSFVRPPFMQIDSAAIVLPRRRGGLDEEQWDVVEIMVMLHEADIKGVQEDRLWQLVNAPRVA